MVCLEKPVSQEKTAASDSDWIPHQESGQVSCCFIPGTSFHPRNHRKTARSAPWLRWANRGWGWAAGPTRGLRTAKAACTAGPAVLGPASPPRGAGRSSSHEPSGTKATPPGSPPVTTRLPTGELDLVGIVKPFLPQTAPHLSAPSLPTSLCFLLRVCGHSLGLANTSHVLISPSFYWPTKVNLQPKLHLWALDPYPCYGTLPLGLLKGLAKLRLLKLNNLTPAPSVLESQTWLALFKFPHFSERQPHLFRGPSRPQHPVSHPQYPRPADAHLLSRMSPFFISSTPLSISEPSPPPSWKLQFSNWPTCIYPAQVPVTPKPRRCVQSEAQALLLQAPLQACSPHNRPLAPLESTDHLLVPDTLSVPLSARLLYTPPSLPCSFLPPLTASLKPNVPSSATSASFLSYIKQTLNSLT